MRFFPLEGNHHGGNQGDSKVTVSTCRWSLRMQLCGSVPITSPSPSWESLDGACMGCRAVGKPTTVVRAGPTTSAI